MKDLDAKKKELIKALGQLGAHKHELRAGREKVVSRAKEQLDSIGKPIDVVAEHLEAGVGGGILGHRRLRTLSTEQGRLHRVLASEEARKRGDDDDNG